MSGIKRLFMLLFIISGIAALGVVVIAGLMIFVPNLTLFGYDYVSAENYKQENSSIMVGEDFTYQKITVDTINADVCIMGANNVVDNTIYVKIQYKFSGFVKQNLLEPEFVITKNQSTGTINVVSLEPKGILFTTQCVLYVQLPSTKNFDEINIVTDNGAVDLGKADSATTATVNDIKVVKTGRKNSITYNENLAIKNSLSFDTDSNKFVANKNIGTESNLININIKSKFSPFEFKNVYGNISVLTESDAPAIYLQNLNGNLEYYAKQGYISAENLNGQATISTTGGDFKLKNVNKSIGLIGSDATIEIENLNIGSENASFETGSGDVKINKTVAGKVSVTTNKGNVKLLNTSCKVDVLTNYGTIDLEYNQTYSNLSAEVVKLTTNYGKIVAKNLRNGVNIQSNNRSQIEVMFLSVSGSNTIKGTSDVKVIAPLALYVLRVQTSTGEIDVALGLSCTTNNWNNSWYDQNSIKKQDFNVNEYITNYEPSKFESAENKIFISTINGKITAKTTAAS